SRSRRSNGTSSPRPAASATFRSTCLLRSKQRRPAPRPRRRRSPGSMPSRRPAPPALDETARRRQSADRLLRRPRIKPRIKSSQSVWTDSLTCAPAMLRSALLNVMIKAAHKASRALKRDFGELEHLQLSVKGPANFVTAADRRAEETLRVELEQARPGYSF